MSIADQIKNLQSEKLNEGQMSMPSATFTRDMDSAFQMRDQFPESAFNGTVNDMMTSQIDSTMADQQMYPDQAAQYGDNGNQSMAGAFDVLQRNNGADVVNEQTWNRMAGLGPSLSAATGVDPTMAAQGGPEQAKAILDQAMGGGAGGALKGLAGLGMAGGAAALTTNRMSELGNGVPTAISTATNIAQGGASAAKGVGKLAGDVKDNTEHAADVTKTVAKDAAEDLAGDAKKGFGALSDLAKSPGMKMAGKAALPLGMVTGAVALASDAGTFKDAITDPFNSEKRDEAVKALREDSPIPGTPLVLDAITDPGKIADTAKDVGKVFTNPGMDSLKNAGKSIADELGF